MGRSCILWDQAPETPNVQGNNIKPGLVLTEPTSEMTFQEALSWFFPLSSFALSFSLSLFPLSFSSSLSIYQSGNKLMLPLTTNFYPSFLLVPYLFFCNFSNCPFRLCFVLIRDIRLFYYPVIYLIFCILLFNIAFLFIALSIALAFNSFTDKRS